ncbi:hypothetical protein KM043_016121 [Ampulex compressa]|nr:hypothetical protein KM043_016121 [Ampulex compressa]
MGSAYRDREDQPLFPQRTTPLSMNNAFPREIDMQIAEYTYVSSFGPLYPAGGTADLGQWKSPSFIRHPQPPLPRSSLPTLLPLPPCPSRKEMRANVKLRGREIELPYCR